MIVRVGTEAARKDEKSNILLSEVGAELQKEYLIFKQRFDYPINPAFFHNSQHKAMARRLPTVVAHFKAEGVPETGLKK